MRFTAIYILILCALGLYGVKHVQVLYRRGILLEEIEKAARKALCFALKGIVAGIMMAGISTVLTFLGF